MQGLNRLEIGALGHKTPLRLRLVEGEGEGAHKRSVQIGGKLSGPNRLILSF